MTSSFFMIKVAAVQDSPKYLELSGTLGKMRLLMEEAADKGCQMIAFPEVYIPGYPYWVADITKVDLEPAVFACGTTERFFIS